MKEKFINFSAESNLPLEFDKFSVTKFNLRGFDEQIKASDVGDIC